MPHIHVKTSKTGFSSEKDLRLPPLKLKLMVAGDLQSVECYLVGPHIDVIILVQSTGGVGLLGGCSTSSHMTIHTN